MHRHMNRNSGRRHSETMRRVETPEATRSVAGKGWRGLLTRVSDDAQGRPLVEGAVEGMSVQRDLAGYLSRRRLINSPHGVCAMLLAASSME